MAASTDAGVATFDPGPTLDRTGRFLAEAAERGHPPEGVRWLEGLVEAAAAGTAGTELGRCLVHGDFRPRHVLLTEDAATVIDWEDSQEGWVHEDAAFFLASLDGFMAQHPRRGWSPAGRLAARAFLRAYLRSGPPGWDRVGALFRVASMVRALNIDYRGRLARRRPRAFRHVVLPHYERWFRAWERGGRR
jgi:aminoglycoside phosphotransferase (APT) family kinase protein